MATINTQPTQENTVNTTTDSYSRVQRSLNSICNIMNIQHNEVVDYQKRSVIVLFIISMAMILSMVTSIIVSYYYMNNINENLEKISILLNTTETQIAVLNDEVDSLKTELDSIKSEEIKIEEIIVTPEEVIIEDTPEVTVYNTTDFTHKSGYTADQFDEIIKTAFTNMNKSDTALIGIGDGLYQAEQEYDVNALYMLGIASLESGWGTSTLATKNNNVYGLVGMKFDSYYDGSVSMGRILRNSYIDKGYDTLDKLQTKYCPSGGKNWVYNIQWCTNKYITAANELYPQL